MLGQLLYNIDLLGLPATLNFAGREKSKSKFGGICSLLFFGFVVWTGINGSRDLLSKTNPKIINSQSNNEEPPGVSMSPIGFPLALQVQTSDDLGFMTYVDDSIYTIDVYFSRAFRIVKDDGTIDTIWNDTKLILEKCRPEHMGPDLHDVYSKIFDLPMQCIAFEQPGLEEEVRISGTYNSEVWRRLLIQLSPCNNETSSVTCAPPETIERIVSGGWLDVLYNNMVVNPNDYARPNGSFQDYFYAMLSLSNYHETYIDLGKIEVATDSGWLMEDMERKSYTNVVKISESTLGKRHPKGILVGVTIEMGKLENYYLRRYKKIQDVLAEVAGLTNAGLLALLILTSPYLRLKFREALMNELFDVKMTIEDPKKKSNGKKGQGSPNNQRRTNRKKGLTVLEKINDYSTKDFLPTKKNNSLNTLSETANIEVDITDTNKYRGDSKDLEKQSNGSSMKEIIQPLTRKRSNPKRLLEKAKHLGNYGSFPSLFLKENNLTLKPLKIVLPDTQEVLSPENKKGSMKELSQQPNAKVLEESDDYGNNFSSFDFDSCNEEGKVKPSQNTDFERKEGVNKIFLSPLPERRKSKRKPTMHAKPAPQAKDIKETTPEVEPSDKECNKIDINFLEYICSFGCRPKALQKKIKVLNEGVKEINARLDVRYILNNIRELEKLVALLLDHDQLLLFENLPKAQLRADGNDDGRGIEVSFKQMLLRKSCIGQEKPLEEQVSEAYNRIKNKKNKSAIDSKLLEVFDESNM